MRSHEPGCRSATGERSGHVLCGLTRRDLGEPWVALRRDSVRAVLDCLPDRERQVIALRFGLDDGEPKTLEQISRRVGLTRERLRQIQEQSLWRLASVRELRDEASHV